MGKNYRLGRFIDSEPDNLINNKNLMFRPWVKNVKEIFKQHLIKELHNLKMKFFDFTAKNLLSNFEANIFFISMSTPVFYFKSRDNFIRTFPLTSPLPLSLPLLPFLPFFALSFIRGHENEFNSMPYWFEHYLLFFFIFVASTFFCSLLSILHQPQDNYKM